MKRSILPRFLAIAAVAASIVASGCKSPTINYPIVQPASLRVMNFAPNCTSPMDVYWAPYPPGPSNPAKLAIANIHYLQYGAASVYTTSITAAPNGTPYQVVVRPTGDTLGSDIKVPITIEPSGKYTIVVTRSQSQPDSFVATVLDDGGTPSAQNTYVRFMNLQANSGPLSVHVDDPVTGTLITATPQDFNSCTPYVALNTALDTSYAFFVTNSANQIISRLTYQTFVAGSYYTLVYAGDLCNTPLDNSADTVNDGNDTLRLRAFDDNQNGADQTNPVPLTYRYNIINAMSPQSGVPITDIGFIVNGANFPEYDNFSVPAIPLDYAGGTYAGFSSSNMFSTSDGDGVINVDYQSGVIPPPPAATLSVSAEGLNGSVNVAQLFTTNITFSPPSTFDAAIIPNNSVSYLFYDDTIKNLTSAGKNIVFSIPDSSAADTAILIFVPGVWGQKTIAVQGTLFYYQPGGSGSGNPVIANRWNNLAGGAETSNLAHTGKPTYKVAVPAGGEPITIYDSIYNVSNNHIPLPSKTFTAYPGGIYEIVSVGNINDPTTYNTLVIRVNGQ